MKRPFLLFKCGPLLYYRLAGEKTFHTTGRSTRRKAGVYIVRLKPLLSGTFEGANISMPVIRMYRRTAVRHVLARYRITCRTGGKRCNHVE